MAPTCCSNKSPRVSTTPPTTTTSTRTSTRCPNRVGGVTVILGPMFSGKTTELLRLHDRHVIARRNCILVKYAGDTRYDPQLIATHSSLTGQGRTVKAHRLAEVRDILFDKHVQIVSIDEGQFFDDLSDTCEELARQGKLVIVAALSGTFERKPFPQISLLLPFANEIKQVTAVCDSCGASAHYTFRSTMDKKVEVIGGSDTYKPLCRECFNDQSVERDELEKARAAGDVRENHDVASATSSSPPTSTSATPTAMPATRAVASSASDKDKDESVPRKLIVLSSM